MSSTRLGAPLAIALLSAAALAGCGESDQTGGGAATLATGLTAVTATATAPNREDVRFAQQMVAHHIQTLEMIDILLGTPDADPRAASIALEIRTNQSPEVARLTDWLSEWRQPRSAGPAPGQTETDEPDTGLAPGEQLRALEDASGLVASRLFLRTMITQHERALELTQRQLTRGQHGELSRLTAQLAEALRSELSQMRALLTNLGA